LADIALHCLSKTFPPDRQAVADIDLRVADGEFVVVVGPSGCGKTTLLRMIAGLETPTQGTVFLGGVDVALLPPHRRNLAMVFQNHALYPHKSVRQNLEFGLKLRRTPRAAIVERVADVARLLSLDPFMDRRPVELSGGERQRIALGRAFVLRPCAMLLDEPFAHLDVPLHLEMQSELKRLQQKLGTTTLHVTHNQAEAMTLADRMVVLRAGRIQQLDAPLAVYERPANLFVARFIGTPVMNVSPKALPAATGFANRALIVGVRPHDVRLVSPADADLCATIDAVQQLGRETVVRFDLGSDEHLTVVLPTDQWIKVGERHGLRLERDKLHLFDPETEHRIA